MHLYNDDNMEWSVREGKGTTLDDIYVNVLLYHCIYVSLQRSLYRA